LQALGLSSTGGVSSERKKETETETVKERGKRVKES
jgi:hypothetical protein